MTVVFELIKGGGGWWGIVGVDQVQESKVQGLRSQIQRWGSGTGIRGQQTMTEPIFRVAVLDRLRA